MTTTPLDQQAVGIVIVGTVRLRPGASDTFLDLMTSLRDGTVREPGCAGFSFGFEAGSPDAVLVQEEYADHTALEAHQGADYVAAYAEALPSLLAEPVTFRIYDVGGVSALTVSPA